MRYSAQIRAARALLGWSQSQLARRAGLGLATLQRIERDEGIEKGKFSTVIKIQKALEQAGIHFIEDDTGEIGVRLKISIGCLRVSSATNLRPSSRQSTLVEFLDEDGDGPGVLPIA